MTNTTNVAQLVPTTPKKRKPVVKPRDPQSIPQSVDPLLVSILSCPRQHNSPSELAFRNFMWSKLAEFKNARTIGPFNMQEKSIGFTVKAADDKRSTTLFSCHMDTVDDPHPADARKKLDYDPTFGFIFLSNDSIGRSLGADDGVGVWIMLKMIEAGVPGTYMFHTGEECGGISAKANASKEGSYLKQFDVCVAFDRPHSNEIITHQRAGTKCASDKFAKALSDKLNALGQFQYKPSRSGVYTDNFEYRQIIAECVNVGVGYEFQHGRDETLDYTHALALVQACCELEWESLPVDRDPTEADPVTNYQQSKWYKDWKREYMGQGHLDWDEWDSAPSKKEPEPKAHHPTNTVPTMIEDAMTATLEDIRFTCDAESGVAADMIVALVREVARLRAEVDQLNVLLGGA